MLRSVNRTQGLVLGFFVFVWVALVIILVAAPEVYDETLKLSAGGRLAGEIAFLAMISAFIALLGVGVFRRWRWVFWLIAVAFLFGVLRLPVSILQLAGLLSADFPVWYTLFQALLGLVQFVIGLAMLSGYRREGAWGRF